jgi:hypothetical protein
VVQIRSSFRVLVSSENPSEIVDHQLQEIGDGVTVRRGLPAIA